ERARRCKLTLDHSISPRASRRLDFLIVCAIEPNPDFNRILFDSAPRNGTAPSPLISPVFVVDLAGCQPLLRVMSKAVASAVASSCPLGTRTVAFSGRRSTLTRWTPMLLVTHRPTKAADAVHVTSERRIALG